MACKKRNQWEAMREDLMLENYQYFETPSGGLLQMLNEYCKSVGHANRQQKITRLDDTENGSHRRNYE